MSDEQVAQLALRTVDSNFQVTDLTLPDTEQEAWLATCEEVAFREFREDNDWLAFLCEQTPSALLEALIDL